MEKQTKMKLIVMLLIAIVLGLFVVTVTAQTITQYDQSCHDLDSSQDREGNATYPSQGCCGRQYHPCRSFWPFN